MTAEPAEDAEAAWVRRQVDAAPPPGQATLDRLAALMAPEGDTTVTTAQTGTDVRSHSTARGGART
jgi:hypothetical protein